MTALLLSLTILALQCTGLGEPLPASHHIAGVPLVERNTNWCGPAALAAVLCYHGEKTSAKQIADAIYLPGFRGSLNLDLLVFARRRGYDARAGEGTPDQLREAVARDRPVICMVRRKGALASANHMVVVRGYDMERSIWFVDSGEGRESRMNAAGFEAEWTKGEHWMLVVEGKAVPEPPRSGGPSPCVQQ